MGPDPTPADLAAERFAEVTADIIRTVVLREYRVAGTQAICATCRQQIQKLILPDGTERHVCECCDPKYTWIINKLGVRRELDGQG